jgi:hypothetical protein
LTAGNSFFGGKDLFCFRFAAEQQLAARTNAPQAKEERYCSSMGGWKGACSNDNASFRD